MRLWQCTSSHLQSLEYPVADRLVHCRIHRRWRPKWRRRSQPESWASRPTRDCRLARFGRAAACSAGTVYWNNAAAPRIDGWFGPCAPRWNRCRRCSPCTRYCCLGSVLARKLCYCLQVHQKRNPSINIQIGQKKTSNKCIVSHDFGHDTHTHIV